MSRLDLLHLQRFRHLLPSTSPLQRLSLHLCQSHSSSSSHTTHHQGTAMWKSWPSILLQTGILHKGMIKLPTLSKLFILGSNQMRRNFFYHSHLAASRNLNILESHGRVNTFRRSLTNLTYQPGSSSKANEIFQRDDASSTTYGSSEKSGPITPAKLLLNSKVKAMAALIDEVGVKC